MKMSLPESHPTPAPAASWARRHGLVLCVTAVLLAGLVYLNALENPFVYDDRRLVVNNPSIHNPFDLRAIVLREITRPLVNISYTVDRAIWGPQPFGFHLTNLLLHMLNVVLLFRVARRLTEDRQRGRPPRTTAETCPEIVAFVAAAMFAVHPMMTEAVSYISGRSEVLCTTFFLLAFLSARQWMIGASGRWRFRAIAFWGLALSTKETAAMLPFVLFCYDRFLLPGRREDRHRRMMGLHLPLFAVTLIAVALRVAVLTLIEYPGETLFRWNNLVVELEVIRLYLVLMLLPFGQSIFHGVSAMTGLLDARALLAVGGVGLIIMLGWRMRRADGAASLGVFWFLLLLIPSAALVVFDLGEPMAEHRVYLASCGFFIVAGSAIGWIVAYVGGASRRSRFLLRASLATALFCLCGSTMLRNATWSDPVVLWLEAAERSPAHWLPHLMLGEALQAAGRREEALVAYRNGLILRPEEKWGYMKLGLCLAEMRRFDEAAATFEKLRRLDPLSTVASTGLGTIAMIRGNREDARRYFLETLQADPQNVAARQSLAMLYETMAANPAEALRLCQEIRQIAPDTPGNDECIRRNGTRLAGSSSGGLP